MATGTYEDFRDALRAFESGWDRARYDAGIIQDWQLDQWAGGTVQEFFPQYASWSELSDEEWDAMSYRSMNSFGFVGYQFGEAFLIDLGYYDDDFYYGNGASTNTWDGTWTGKNGVDSLEEFMTKDAQEIAIQEAFGLNLKLMTDGLAAAGKTLDDYLGTTRTYIDGQGESVTVTISVTGLLAAAHLRGAPATVDLLLNGSVTADEYGTSILQYVEQFGGFDFPGVDEAIAFYEDRLTGDEGLGTPGDGSGGGDTVGNGTADVTAETADVVVTWNWGQHTVVEDFDPAGDTIFIDWFTAEEIEVAEVDGSVVFSVPSNLSSTTLEGITLAELSAANFTIMDSGTAAEVLGLVGDDGTGDTGDGDGDDGDTGDGGDDGDTGGQDGTTYLANAQGPDIVGFDPAVDRLDFGQISVHNLILAKLPSGEVALDDVWSPAMQVLQGIDFQDLSVETFGVVQNEHLRQDVGGVVSWELGIGPREADTVYIRSHEYGVQEVIDGFDPATMKISFLYFGTRERLSVEDTDQGLVISVLPSGQTFTFTGVQLSDLAPGRVEFHHDQVIEDNLEVPFGFAQEDVTLVDRTVLLTPEGPAGQITDGHQTHEGVMTPPGGDDTGDDGIYLGSGNDEFRGDAGDESVFGESGYDRLFGGQGEDALDGGDGNDRLFGQGGADTLQGDAGDDLARGGSANDEIRGGAGDDRLFGDGGRDRLFGDGGADLIEGGAASDYLRGGSGADTFVFHQGDGADTISDFATGLDQIDLTSHAGIAGTGDIVQSTNGNDAVAGLGGGDTIVFVGLEWGATLFESDFVI